MDTLIVKITDRNKAFLLLEPLSTMDFIESAELIDNLKNRDISLSDKYKGILTKAHGQKLNEHIEQMRSEWS